MDRMINWLSSDVTTPEPGRELIVKNTKRVLFGYDDDTRCRIVKFSPGEPEQGVSDWLDVEKFDLWAYTDEGDQHE